MPREFVLDRRIADDTLAWVVAELGNNHGGSEQAARAMMDAAAAAGASAVKFQMRDNATLYTPAMRAMPYVHDHSFGATYGEHRDALELNPAAMERLRWYGHAQGVFTFTTVFDEVSADRAMRAGMPALKLASAAVTDTALLDHVAPLGVPLILSTGGATSQEIDAAVQRITAHTPRLALLHCTAAYPVRDFAELNLRYILTLRARYPETVIGWSGHDSGIAMALIAYAFGARIIEKHFTLNRALKGTDHAFSLEPAGLKKLVRDLDRAHVAMGDGLKHIYLSEIGPLSKMRRTVIGDHFQIGTADERAAVHSH